MYVHASSVYVVTDTCVVTTVTHAGRLMMSGENNLMGLLVVSLGFVVKKSIYAASK